MKCRPCTILVYKDLVHAKIFLAQTTNKLPANNCHLTVTIYEYLHGGLIIAFPTEYFKIVKCHAQYSIPDNRMVWVWLRRGRGCGRLKIQDSGKEMPKGRRRYTDSNC